MTNYCAKYFDICFTVNERIIAALFTIDQKEIRALHETLQVIIFVLR